MYPKERKAPSIGVESRDSTAIRLLNQAAELADRAGIIAERAENRLGPIMGPGNPVGRDDEKCPVVCLPPYFEDVRNVLARLERALDSLEDSINRVDF